MMYSGWISERESIENECGSTSVLNNYPPHVGRDVTSSIIRSLVHHPNEKKFFFKTDKDILWTMDVICFGLTMPLSEVEMIKNCVFIYLDWTTVMSKFPKVGIPIQIANKKEDYFMKMLAHLTNLFIPRESTATVLQAKFCSQVLHQIKTIVTEGQLDKKTSEFILRFYLGISGHLLSVPPMQGGLADLLCEQLINSLITIWLHISCYFFPSPAYWCTLGEMFISWRHHHILILQWNKLMFILTSKVLLMLFGPNYPLPRLYKDDNTDSIVLPNKLNNELTVQCWFRFLHIIGNPVALTKVNVICGTEHFMQYAMEQGRPVDSHPCLKSLPQSFYKVMKGIAVLVGMFLGTSQTADKRSFSMSSNSFARGDWKSMSTSKLDKHAKYAMEIKEKAATAPGIRKNPAAVRKTQHSKDDFNLQPKEFNTISADTNCILHLFGGWLFDASLSGVRINKVLEAIGMISCGMKPKSFFITPENESSGLSFPPVKKNEYELGRAQAFSILCHIFCHQRTVEHAILPVYLSRFYLSVAVGLCYGESRAGQVLGSILLTAKNMFQIDLQGVQILIPHMLQALELILPVPENELVLGYDVNITALRQSCLEILLSIVCLPLHFLAIPIQGLCRDKIPTHSSESNNGYIPNLTFISLKKRITQLLMDALEVETNPLNTQMLLGGAMLLIEDTMYAEGKPAIKLKSHLLPNIVVHDSEAVEKGSPKLIHIAKTTQPKEEEGEVKKEKLKRNFSVSEIGTIGVKDDILTTQGLFYYMIDRLCQKLMFGGKLRGDLNVTLAALECIADLSQLEAKFTHERSAKKALIWVCEYIGIQAKQPPPAHSKDLHSIIVAAFSCISSWLINHPWLMDDHKCLDAVLEVIELGISGSKSKEREVQISSDVPALKGNKELKPVSFRVRESAEALLALIMEQLDFFPTPNGAASLSSLLDETQIAEDNDISKFEYYAVDGSFIIGIADNNQLDFTDDIPTVMSVLRGPTGKRVCLMQMRHFSRAKQHLSDIYEDEPVRPSGLQNIPSAPEISQRCFPIEVERVQKIKADFSIPSLDDILDEKNKELQDQMTNLINIQSSEEASSQEKRKNESISSSKDNTQKQPQCSDYHKASKLFLSHMGMMNIQNLVHAPPSANQQIGLQYLQHTGGEQELEQLFDSLSTLDLFPSRTYDTMHVFFVKKGQKDPNEILSNKIPSLDNQFFMEFLYSLGWSVNLSNHTGWNGDFSTSWQPNNNHKIKGEKEKKQMFYYANLLTELAIHVPALNLDHVRNMHVNLFSTEIGDKKKEGSITEEYSTFEVNEKQVAHHSLDVDGRQRKITSQFELKGSVEAKHRSYNSQSETKILITWLQHYADHANFPTLDLVDICYPNDCTYSHGNNVTTSRVVPDKEIVVVFIHPLKTGLFRVKVQALYGSAIGGPLHDGMVVSRRSLGIMVRNTAINIFRRRRLEIDSFSPPHVCRKMKIQEIIKKHAKPTNKPEFFANQFRE